MGYRKIAKYLNAMGHKTYTGKVFTNNSVQFIIKRGIERQKKLELINREDEFVISDFKMNF